MLLHDFFQRFFYSEEKLFFQFLLEKSGFLETDFQSIAMKKEQRKKNNNERREKKRQDRNRNESDEEKAERLRKDRERRQQKRLNETGQGGSSPKSDCCKLGSSRDF